MSTPCQSRAGRSGTLARLEFDVRFYYRRQAAPVFDVARPLSLLGQADGYLGRERGPRQYSLNAGSGLETTGPHFHS